jgi:hypothetical protein
VRARMRNGTIFRRQPLAPLTGGTGSGLLHTPTATANQASPSMRDRDAGSWFREEKMWPTPHGMCVPNDRRAGPSGNELGRAVNRAEWPTPKAQPSGPDYARASREGSGGDDLATAVDRVEREKWPTPLSAPTSEASHGQFSGTYRTALAKKGVPMIRKRRNTAGKIRYQAIAHKDGGKTTLGTYPTQSEAKDAIRGFENTPATDPRLVSEWAQTWFELYPRPQDVHELQQPDHARPVPQDVRGPQDGFDWSGGGEGVGDQAPPQRQGRLGHVRERDRR